MDYEALDNLIADVNNDAANVADTLSFFSLNFGELEGLDDNFHYAFKNISEAYKALREAARLLESIE